jgi:hypothetical protein
VFSRLKRLTTKLTANCLQYTCALDDYGMGKSPPVGFSGIIIRAATLVTVNIAYRKAGATTLVQSIKTFMADRRLSSKPTTNER